jgi:hypothetical protein
MLTRTPLVLAHRPQFHSVHAGCACVEQQSDISVGHCPLLVNLEKVRNLAFIPRMDAAARDLVGLGQTRRIGLDPVQGNRMVRLGSPRPGIPVTGVAVIRLGSITICGGGKPASRNAFSTLVRSDCVTVAGQLAIDAPPGPN